MFFRCGIQCSRTPCFSLSLLSRLLWVFVRQVVVWFTRRCGDAESRAVLLCSNKLFVVVVVVRRY